MVWSGKTVGRRRGQGTELRHIQIVTARHNSVSSPINVEKMERKASHFPMKHIISGTRRDDMIVFWLQRCRWRGRRVMGGVSARLGCVIQADAGISTKYENIVYWNKAQ